VTEHYRRLPQTDANGLAVARYKAEDPGSTVDILQVARMADMSADVCEVQTRYGWWCLVRWLPESGHDWIAIPRGDYLAYSKGSGLLYATTEVNLAAYYEKVPDAPES
jgi:hypothetical protein